MKPAAFTPTEHYAMALTLAAVVEGHRRVNAGSAARDAVAHKIMAASRWFSDLGLALEMTIPVRTPSPYFKEYAVVPPDTNDDLIALLKNGVGAALEGRASPKIIKMYQKLEDALRLIPDRDLERRRVGVDPWGNSRPKW